MSATLSPAAAALQLPAPVSGGRSTRVNGQIVHVAPAPQLLDVQAVAEMLGCSPRHVYRLSDAGRMPGPVKLGALVRWNSASIREWIQEGCPRVGRRAGR